MQGEAQTGGASVQPAAEPAVHIPGTHLSIVMYILYDVYVMCNMLGDITQHSVCISTYINVYIY